MPYLRSRLLNFETQMVCWRRFHWLSDTKTKTKKQSVFLVCLWMWVFWGGVGCCVVLPVVVLSLFFLDKKNKESGQTQTTTPRNHQLTKKDQKVPTHLCQLRQTKKKRKKFIYHVEVQKTPPIHKKEIWKFLIWGGFRVVELPSFCFGAAVFVCKNGLCFFLPVLCACFSVAIKQHLKQQIPVCFFRKKNTPSFDAHFFQAKRKNFVLEFSQIPKKTHVLLGIWRWVVNRFSERHALRPIPRAQYAFEVLMIHWILQFALKLSKFAPFFIFAGTKISIAKSCSLVFVVYVFCCFWPGLHFAQTEKKPSRREKHFVFPLHEEQKKEVVWVFF